MRKKLILLILVSIVLSSCNNIKKVLHKGEMHAAEQTHIVRIDFAYNVPLCIVSINEKNYRFLIDTGAPTCISESLFEELGLKKKSSIPIRDSNKNKRSQILSSIPRLEIGDLLFTDVGCVVTSFDNQDMIRCLDLDGIIGSNTMSKAFWEFDYSNELVKVSKRKSDFNIDDYDFTLDFTTSMQKTPKVKGSVGNKEITFTFDTGSSGEISVRNEYDYYKSETPDSLFTSFYGSRSAGLFGLGEASQFFALKSTLTLSNHPFKNVLMTGSKSNLIGNLFLKNFVFLIDWDESKIRLKQIEKAENKPYSGFGFHHIIHNEKYLVGFVSESYPSDVEIGDEIISINGENYSDFSFSNLCYTFFIKRELNEKDIADVVVVRKADTLQFQCKKSTYIP